MSDTGLQLLGKALTWLRTAIVDISVVAVTCAISYFVIADVEEGTYLIEPISVPENFQKDIQDKDGVAAHLRDAIGILSQRARDGVAIRPTVADPSEPKVSLTGTSFSIRDIATFIREHSGAPYTIITGELSMVKSNWMRVQARIISRDVKAAGSFDAQIEQYRDWPFL